MPVNREIEYNSQLHNDIRDAVLSRRDYSHDEMSRFHRRWRQAEEQALAYLPKTEEDQKRDEKREEEGKPQYTTLEVPYSYALLMTAHTYYSSVFLSRTPIFQFTGRHGETQNQTMGVEALIDYQMHVGRNIVPIYVWLYDVPKYGLGVIGCYWDEEEEAISELVEKPKFYKGIPIPGTKKKVKQTRRVKGFQGNKLFNVRPFDWRPDPRVSIKRFQEGEFCGRRTDVGWNTILAGQETGKYFNVEALKKKRAKTVASENREEGSEAMEEPDTHGRAWVGSIGRDDLNTIELEEMVIELSPKEWGLGEKTFPEKWAFTIANDEVLMEARPLGYNHNKFPFEAIEYDPDTYQLSSRGMMDTTRELNDAMTWLFNQHFYNVRRVLNDQFVFDPSRIVMKDMMSNEPGKLIRMKPAAYGQDIRQMIQQFPVQDITRAHIEDAQIVGEIMQRVSGITDNIMGQVNEGGRKTATEVRSTNTSSLNRLKNDAEFFSAMGFEPLGQMMVQNTQQFYDQDALFKIAGSTIRGEEDFMQVTAQEINGFYDVVPVDGTLPVDRFAMSNLFKEMISDMMSLGLGQEFDIARMYEHAMSLAGIRNTDQFRIEVKSDQELQEREQNGEVTPLGPGGPNGGGPATAGGDTTLAERETGRPREPGQIPGMGATG